MTLTELQTTLLNRIGWEETSGTGLTVTAANQTSDSGRFFQEGHHAITLSNIHETIEVIDADDTVFNEYLEKFRKRAVIQTVSDVFNRSTVDDTVVSELSTFDNAIIYRLTINVCEMIIASVRSNRTERITKDFANKLFFDINGGNGNMNFPNYIGIKDKYGKEIKNLKDQFNTGRSLDTLTLTI